eukprot:4701885-Amphidinium_carterae.1
MLSPILLVLGLTAIVVQDGAPRRSTLFILEDTFQASDAFNMLDLITLVSTMGLQEELSKNTKESRVIKQEDSGDDSLIQQAADSL